MDLKINSIFTGSKEAILKFWWLAFGFLIAWHHCYWFSYSNFFNAELLSQVVTYTWLINLASFVGTIVFVIVSQRSKLSISPNDKYFTVRIVSASIILAISSLALSFLNGINDLFLIAYALSVIMGVAEATLWILWGVLSTYLKVSFSIRNTGYIIGGLMLISSLISMFMPKVISSIFIALMPLIFLLLLLLLLKKTDVSFFTSQPPQIQKDESAISIIQRICIGVFVAAFSCYYLIAIIPWEDLIFQQRSFEIGTLLGAILLVIMGGYAHLSKYRNLFGSSFNLMFSVLLVAFMFFLLDQSYYLASFLLALSVFTVLEVEIIAFFARLTANGFLSSVLAFGFAAGFARAGILGGNTLAVFYEAFPEFRAQVYEMTGLILAVILLFSFISVIKQSYAIDKITQIDDFNERMIAVSEHISKEFALSPKESEVLTEFALNKTAEEIAESMQLSIHTINTHIRHIYEKTGIHRKNDLLKYIHKLGDEIFN